VRPPTIVDAAASGAEDSPLRDTELRALLARARAQDDPELMRLILGYITLRRVMADVIALIEARDGGAAVARSPLLLRARELSGDLVR